MSQQDNEEAQLVSALLEEAGVIDAQFQGENSPAPVHEEIADCECEPASSDMPVEEIIVEVYSLIDQAETGSAGDSDITLPLDFYYGHQPGLSKVKAKDKNASKYVSMDVQDSVEATVAEISNMFSTKEIAVFTAENEADEDQAIMESELVNYIFFDEMDGYMLLQTALRDSLIHRNCSARVCWDERTVVTVDEINNVNPLMLPQILAPREEGEKVEVIEQIVEHTEVNVEGYQLPPQESMSLKIKRTQTVGEPLVEIIKPENIIVSELHAKSTLDDARFSAFKNITTVSELIAQGFDKDIVEQLPEYSTSESAYARQHGRGGSNDFSSTQTSNKTVMVYECYLDIDIDQDGINEYRRIIVAEHNLLLNEIVEANALVGGTTTSAPHTYSGISLFDKLAPIQEAKTHIFRSIIDGTRLSSNPRLGVVGKGVRLDDILQSRTGGIVRMENPNSIVNIPSNEVPQSSYSFLSMMDSVRNQRGGSAISTASQAQSVAGDTAHGVERVMSAIEMSNALLAKTFSETFIRSIFKELHNVVRTNVKGEITAKIKGRWVTSNPARWNKRKKLTITMGGSTNERNRKAMSLEQVIQKQERLAQAGSPLFSEQKLYNALTQQAKLAGLPAPDSYYVDPQSEEGQRNTQQKQQIQTAKKAKNDEADAKMQEAQTLFGQAEMAKGQAALQSSQSKLAVEQMKGQLEMLQTRIDKQESDARLAFDYEKMYIDQGVKIAEAEAKHNAQLDAEVKQAREELEKEIFAFTPEGGDQ